MAQSDRLRIMQIGQQLNIDSRKQEKEIIQSLLNVVKEIKNNFNIEINHQFRWYLSDVVQRLECSFPSERFFYHSKLTYMQPDGGILSILDENKNKYPILISEVKKQGTNDLRSKEGKKKQAAGNAIERLGKNVIGFRCLMLKESIFPFICFGYGCDFAMTNILDRVSTICMFGPLNQIHLDNGESSLFNRGSFYFKEEKWEIDEMAQYMYEIAEKSIYYYFSRYGKDVFIKA